MLDRKAKDCAAGASIACTIENSVRSLQQPIGWISAIRAGVVIAEEVKCGDLACLRYSLLCLENGPILCPFYLRC